MGLKENFNQAMRELLNKGGLVGSEMEEKAKAKSDLDSYLEPPAPVTAEPAAHSGGAPEGEPAGTPGNTYGGTYGSTYTGTYGSAPGSPSGNVPFDQDSSKITMSVSETDWQNPPYEEHTSFRPTPSGFSQSQDGEFGRMFRQAEEMTIISKSTMIVGDIRTLANITIEGNVRGKVDALKDASIRGMLIGDLTCNNTDIRGSSIQGNVSTKGSTYIDSDSILLGDVQAQFASIDGKVKGNIDISSKVELRHNAIVAGNINTNTISIEDGANIRGFVNTTFLKEHGDSAFPKQVIIDADSAGENPV
ncbi:protein CcmA, bactofilin family [Sporobacter termitidis DSM 10068]|uniref:Protein CcmA, bactofilin family n=1 Tax=Sporobacter termitidis DSM 10068 TaxID=1123282 RepID=A0A1M5YCH5_9FIRM|nr:polymer-forming cytoskeletal protein [Sporobacter termitidis]SHI09672.1 protein CcmA, bactofilin family [Sporobacter termitidis DSM 10068]